MPDKTSLLREKLLDLFMDAPIAAAAKSFQELEQSWNRTAASYLFYLGTFAALALSSSW